MDIASSSQDSPVVATAIDHPRLTKTEPSSIRSFLREYDQYTHEITARAQQLVNTAVVSTDVARPIQLKYCVPSEWLESVIDLLSRWVAAPTLRRLVTVPTLPSSSGNEFTWPHTAELKAAQMAHSDDRPNAVSYNADGLYSTPAGAVWIPEASTDLQLRLCIIAHTGPSGHRAASTTADMLRTQFYWRTLEEDILVFVRSCIHCLSTTGGGKTPRPYGPAVHGTCPNDLLQFDYITLTPAASGELYVLMLRDDHSNYCWFFPFPDTSAENAARAIIDWCAAFGVPHGLMSDGPTHFRNETLRLVAKGLRVPHHFTLPYAPWSNGGIERLGKELLRVLRSTSSELQLAHEEWPDLLPLVQSAINNAPSPQRAGVPPIKAMTGMAATPPIATFYRAQTSAPVTVSDLVHERALNVDMLCDLVGQLRPIIQDAVQKNRQQGRDVASKGSLPNFTKGDYVLVAREDFHAGEKLCLRWRGPRRVLKPVNDFVYLVEDLRDGTTSEVHITRLKFYHDASLDTNAIMSHIVSSETGMVVHRLMELVQTNDGIHVRIRWRGLPDSEDTLEPVAQVYQDVPDLLLKLLKRKNTPVHLANQLREELHL